MAAIHTWKGYGHIKLVAPYEIQSLGTLEIRRRVGEHARLYLTAILPDEHKDQSVQLKVKEETVEIQETDADGALVRILFHGRVEQLEIGTVRGVYQLKLKAVSHSILLDRKVESRSFQLGSQSTSEVIERVVMSYDEADMIDTTRGADRLESLVLQYRETDWEFIKRLASASGAVIIPESAASSPKLWIGVPDGALEELPQDVPFTVGRDLAAYGQVQAVGLKASPADFTYYEVETEKWLNLGDKVNFRGKELAVAAAVSVLKDGTLVHTYTLRLESGIRQPFYLNDRITGVSLDGKIIDVQKDRVRVHLDIDEIQDKSLAVWLPFESPYTAEGSSGLYVMPQLGDAVQVYFQSAREEEAMVRGSVRKSGQPSPKLEDPNTKYWGTNYGKELKFGTSDMSLTATEGSLFISLEDSEGITIQSDSSIVMSAKKDLEWTSEKKIGITAQQAIYLLSGSSSLVLDGNSDIRGEEVELDGLIKAPVSVEDLEPQPEAPFAEEEKKEEKKGFWNKFLDVTQVVLDVVGCIPVVGEIADLANAGISLARGDYVGAALSVASAIPFAGWAATGAKAARRVAQATKLGSKAVKAVDKAATVVKSAKEVAESLTVAGMGSLGKVYTGARSMGSNLNQADVLQKLKTAMQNLETNRPRMAMAMSMASGTAVNYYKSEAQEAAVAKIQEEGWAPQEAITLLGILTNGGRRKGGHGGSSGIVSGGGSGGGNHGSGSGNHGSGSVGSGKKPDVGEKDKNPHSTVPTQTKVNYGDHYTRKDRKKALKENVEYTTPAGYTYRTDDKGRLINVEGKLKLGNGKRNNHAQRVVGRNNRRKTDEGGHLIASIFEGSGSLDNLVAMDGNLNKGEWKRLENMWAKQLQKGKSVEVRIRPIFKGDSERPDSFEIEYKIGNGRWKDKRFDNEPGGKKDE
ncbi:DNA/RNA non-specific endonuclease [Paenibacillus jiagnxiensis]|uniref:DNA/RNA non-specific endonuclease n=1 Tax=Paenibacillus jiagnxiensis TaxID=3228926 RepID=UPI0033AD0A82